MEPCIFLGFRKKSSEYILIANGEATTARTIRRRPVPGRWTNLEKIVNRPVWPSDRLGHRQAATVRPMGERRDRNHEPDEALLPKPPAEAGPSKRVYLEQSDFDAHGLTQGCPGCRAYHHRSRLDTCLYLTLPRPCSLSCSVQAPSQSPAASCPGVDVEVVGQLDERLWEKLCIEIRTPDVNDCYIVVLALSSRRGMTEYTFHQIQSRSRSVMLTVKPVHPCALLCNPSSTDIWFLRCSFVRDNP